MTHVSLENNTPKINFGSLKSREYSISIKYFDDEKAQPSKRIDYKLKIELKPQQKNYLLDIYKENIWFNQHEPDLISEMISNELSKIIYPLRVMTDECLTMKDIVNHRFINTNRWFHNQSKITEKYQTPTTQAFYSAFEKNLESKARFVKNMQNDWFWCFFFHPKYINYGKEHSTQTDLYLSVAPFQSPIKFIGIQKINTEITNYHSIIVLFVSEENKAPSHLFSKKDNLELYMHLNVQFDLDVFYLFPMHTIADLEIYSKNENGEKTIVKRISFSQYQQNTEQNKKKPREKRSPFLVYEEEEDKNKTVYKTYQGKDYNYQQWVKFEEEQYKIYKEKREQKQKKGFWDFLK